MMRIAIIGAGMSGLTLAHYLSPFANVTLFEQMPEVGGRLASRQHDPYSFDYGAQFFVAKTKDFKQFLKPFIHQGVLRPWYARFQEISEQLPAYHTTWHDRYPHYVGIPNMTHWMRTMAENQHIKLTHTIMSLHHDQHWFLSDQHHQQHGPFDWVVITCPPQPMMRLLNTCPKHPFPDHHAPTMDACFSLMLGLKKPWLLPFDAALVHHPMISWISVNSHKPGHNQQAMALLVHTSNRWANQHLHDDPVAISQQLMHELTPILGQHLDTDYRDLHIWQEANLPKQKTHQQWCNPQQQIACIGDWCYQGRVESAFTHAHQLAKYMIKEVLPCKTA